MVALPVFTAVANPEEFTVATDEEDEPQVADELTFCVLPSLRFAVAVNCCVVPLAMLAVASCMFTLFFEAGWIWAVHGYGPSDTLRNDFSLDLGITPAWELLALGLLIAGAAFVRQSLRLRATG